MIDVVYKYADFNDPELSTVNHIKKDNENGELRYSLRSVFKNMPWVNKIWIVMPNSKLRFISHNDKIKYVKDSYLLDHPSKNTCVFQFLLWKLKKLGCSNHIIYMDDDYFIGRHVTPSTFFYHDGAKLKPYVLSDIKLDTITTEDIDRALYKIKHSTSNEDFKFHKGNAHVLQRLNSIKFVSELANSSYLTWHLTWNFFHNALGINLDDLELLYNTIKDKYLYSEQFLNSTERTEHDLQFQELWNVYNINILGRRYYIADGKYYEMPTFYNKLSRKMILPTLFCINTPGIYPNPTSQDIKNFNKLMQRHFPKPIPGEIVKQKFEMFNGDEFENMVNGDVGSDNEGGDNIGSDNCSGDNCSGDNDYISSYSTNNDMMKNININDILKIIQIVITILIILILYKYILYKTNKMNIDDIHSIEMSSNSQVGDN